MPSDKRDQYSWTRYSSLGFEFVAVFGIFATLGYWIDSSWDSSPWGLIVGAALGLIGGMYKLVKTSLAAFEDSSDRRPDRDERSDQ